MIKRRPYRVPDGYFAELEERLTLSTTRPCVSRRSSALHLATAFALASVAVAAFLFSLKHIDADDEFPECDRYVYADIIPHTDPFLVELSSGDDAFTETDYSY